MTLADKREFDEAFRVRDRKVAKEQGIDEGKDGDIGANAQGQRENCDCGETGIFAQRAEGVAEVLPELVHDGSLQNMSRAGFYPDLRQVGSAFPAPKIQGGVIFRFLSGHAA